MSGFDNEVVKASGMRLEPSTPQDIYLMQKVPNSVSKINYVGDPNGAVSANPSSECHDPVSGAIYRKSTGTGNTGWVSTGQAYIGQLAYFPNANGDSYLNGLWLKCNGQVLNQADYPDLFARVGFVNGPFTIFQNATAAGGNRLTATYDGSRFIVAGVSGQLYTSPDGINWTLGTSGTSSTISSIVFTGAIYASSVASSALTSTDLITWSTVTSNNRATSTLKYGNSTFVVSNADRFIATSTDGTSWFTKSPNGSRLAFNSGKIAIGSKQNCILTSTNTSVGWKVNSAEIAYTASILNLDADVSGFFCSVGGSSTVASSTDGYTWVPHATGTTSTWVKQAFGAGVYVFGASASGTTRATTDFVTYSANVGTIGSAAVSGLAFGASKFVATNNATGTIYTSANGINWSTSATIAGMSSITALRFVNGLFFVTGATGAYSTSTDAITWSAVTTPFGNKAITGLVFANGVYTAAFNDGMVGTSTDAITWSTQTSAVAAAAGGLIYDGSNYYMSGDGYLQTSTNGTAWSVFSNLSLDSADQIQNLNFASGLFLAGTSQGKVLTSTDGLTWVTNSTATTSSIGAVNYAAGIYLVSSSYNLWTSTNLVTYSPAVVNTLTTQTFQTLGYANGLHLAGGTNALIRTSTDGVMWGQVTNSLVTTTTVIAFAASTSTIILGGGGGALAYSQNVYPYDETTQFQLPTDAQIGITVESLSNFRRSLYIRAKTS